MFLTNLRSSSKQGSTVSGDPESGPGSRGAQGSHSGKPPTPTYGSILNPESNQSPPPFPPELTFVLRDAASGHAHVHNVASYACGPLRLMSQPWWSRLCASTSSCRVPRDKVQQLLWCLSCSSWCENVLVHVSFVVGLISGISGLNLGGIIFFFFFFFPQSFFLFTRIWCCRGVFIITKRGYAHAFIFIFDFSAA